MKVRSRSLSVSAALGGRSAASLRSWLVMLVPSAILVVFQEHATLAWWVALVSAAVQHLAVGALLVPLGSMRSRLPIIPLPFMFVVWSLVGVIRAVIGSGIVLIVTGDDPHFVYRLLFWTAISVIWTPMFIYSEAQRQHRRVLRSAWSDETEQLAIENGRSHQPSTELRARLVAAVRESMLPVIHEIQRSLSAARMEGQALDSISGRLGTVTRDATRIIETDTPETIPRSPRALNNRATLVAAGDFHRTRPLFVTGLTVLLLLTVLIPTALLAGGVSAALFLLPVLTVTAVTLLAGLLLAGLQPSRGILPVYGAFSAAAAAGLAVVLLTADKPFELGSIALALFFAPAVILTAASISTAIGLGVGNEELAASLSELESQVQALRTASAHAESRVREQVATLMHGPVLGRLSACVMALNFHASSDDARDPVRTAEVTRNVLDHLALAASDLESLR